MFANQVSANTNEDKISKYIKIYGDTLKKDLSFMQLCKQAGSSKFTEQAADPKLNFFKDCNKG